MTITAQQIADLRADIGDNGNPPAFEDPDVARIWERVSGAQNAIQRHEAALGLMARQLLSNAARLHDYTAGQNEEKLDQVFKHLQAIAEMYRPALEAALGKKKEFVMAKLKPVPRQGRQYPMEDERYRQRRFVPPGTALDDWDE